MCTVQMVEETSDSLLSKTIEYTDKMFCSLIDSSSGNVELNDTQRRNDCVTDVISSEEYEDVTVLSNSCNLTELNNTWNSSNEILQIDTISRVEESRLRNTDELIVQDKSVNKVEPNVSEIHINYNKPWVQIDNSFELDNEDSIEDQTLLNTQNSIELQSCDSYCTNLQNSQVVWEVGSKP